GRTPRVEPVCRRPPPRLAPPAPRPRPRPVGGAARVPARLLLLGGRGLLRLRHRRPAPRPWPRGLRAVARRAHVASRRVARRHPVRAPPVALAGLRPAPPRLRGPLAPGHARSTRAP